MIADKLLQYGYISPADSYLADVSVLEEALIRYRDFNQIPDSISDEDMFTIPRCGLPDFGIDSTGSGSWPVGCYPNWPRNHAVIYRVVTSGIPGYLAGAFDEAWDLMTQAYQNIGLVIIRDDNTSSYNSLVTFQRGSGWIGLAIVGRNQRCNTRMWAKFDNRYGSTFPRQRLIYQWAFLIAHELGHNCGMGHTRGGIMNPSLISGTFTPNQWRNDVAYPTLRRWYGGEPVAPIWTIPQPENPV